MTAPIKLTIAGLSISGIAVGTGLGIHHLTKSLVKEEKQASAPAPVVPTKKTVLQWLGSKKMISDDNTKNDAWNKKWEAFKAQYTSTAPVGDWQIAEWDTKKANDQGLPAFKALCKTNLEKEADKQNATLVTEFIKHCVEE